MKKEQWLDGIACARRAPRISHLFFADDSIIFGKADETNCFALKEVLETYEQASGQVINS